jgi:hypothetical protein
MKVLKALFNFYINGSFHVALSVVAFTTLSCIELQIWAPQELIAFVFCATIAAYNFVKYFGFQRSLQGQLLFWIKVMAILSLLAFALALFFLAALPTATILTVVVLGLLTLFYAMPVSMKIHKENDGISLRGLRGLKIFIIAIVWTATTVLLPVFQENTHLNTGLFILLVQRFFWILVLMIPFEIRDLKYDHESLGTMPQKIGVEGSKRLGYVLLCLIAALELFKSTVALSVTVIHMLMLVLAGVLIWKTDTKRSDYYSSFWVEGLPVLWLLLVLMFG